MGSDTPRRIRTAQEPVDAEFTAPPSKSVTQRALILSALASGTSTLVNPLDADDTRTLVRALETLGFILRCAPGQWELEGRGGAIPSPCATVDAGEAGTAARFLTALVGLGRGRFMVDGSARMRERPLRPLVEGLRQLGVAAHFRGRDGCLPVEIVAQGLQGGSVRIGGDKSSQFLSALLLVAPKASSPLRIEPEGRQASSPYIGLTVKVMEAFGAAPTVRGPLVFDVPAPRNFAGIRYEVEGDYSSAGYFFAAAAITAGRVRVNNLKADSAQADRAMLDVLQEMGCRIAHEGSVCTLVGGALSPFQRDLSAMPDAVPALAVTALFARGTSRLEGLSTLRLKESDRVSALAAELARLGAAVREGSDFLEITPRPLHGALLETYGDHRMAMSLALAGLRVPNVEIRDPACVSKSYPNFWEEFSRLENATV